MLDVYVVKESLEALAVYGASDVVGDLPDGLVEFGTLGLLAVCRCQDDTPSFD